MQKSYEVIKNKVDAGISAREEMFQAELNLATTKSDFENNQVSLENAKDDFKILIGMSLFDDMIVLPNIAVDTVRLISLLPLTRVWQTGWNSGSAKLILKFHSSILSRPKRLMNSREILAFQSAFLETMRNVEDVYANPTDNEDVALSLTIPLWDWGERKSRIKATEASIETANISFEEEKK